MKPRRKAVAQRS